MLEACVPHDRLIKDGYTHVVDADLQSYFDTIPHDRLMARIVVLEARLRHDVAEHAFGMTTRSAMASCRRRAFSATSSI